MNGQANTRTKFLEDILWMYLIYKQTYWGEFFPLREISHNNNYQSSEKIKAFKLLDGRPHRIAMSWDIIKVWFLVGHQVIHEIVEYMTMTMERMKEAHGRKKSYVDTYRIDQSYNNSDKVFLRDKYKRAY